MRGLGVRATWNRIRANPRGVLDPRNVSRPSLRIHPLTALGLALVVTVVWSVFIYRLFRAGLPPGEAQVLVGIGGIFATVALATGIYIQAHQNEKLVENTIRQTTVLQETEWIPEVRQPLGANQLAFARNRPWYPYFRADVGGETSGWYEEWIRRYSEAKDPLVEWAVPFPDGVKRFFIENLDPGEHMGELHFRFESMNGAEYFFSYHIRLEVADGEYEILETPSVDRYLPWEESSERDDLEADLESAMSRQRSVDEGLGGS